MVFGTLFYSSQVETSCRSTHVRSLAHSFTNNVPENNVFALMLEWEYSKHTATHPKSIMSIVKIVIDFERKKNSSKWHTDRECLEPLSFSISLFSNTHTYIILCRWLSIRLQYFAIQNSLKIFITTITTKNGNYCFSFVCNAPVLDFAFGFLFFSSPLSFISSSFSSHSNIYIFLLISLQKIPFFSRFFNGK